MLTGTRSYEALRRSGQTASLLLLCANPPPDQSRDRVFPRYRRRVGYTYLESVTTGEGRSRHPLCCFRGCTSVKAERRSSRCNCEGKAAGDRRPAGRTVPEEWACGPGECVSCPQFRRRASSHHLRLAPLEIESCADQAVAGARKIARLGSANGPHVVGSRDIQRRDVEVGGIKQIREADLHAKSHALPYGE